MGQTTTGINFERKINMKVLIKKHQDRYDDLMYHKMFINDKEVLHIGRCEPEDAIIGRDLVDADEVLKLMKIAFSAGVNTENFDVEIKDVDAEEFWK